MKVKSLLFVGIAMMGIAFTSCSKEENLFDNEAAQADMFAKYSANFVKKYGPIDPNQTWDFATMSPVYLPVSKGATTRAAAADIKVTRAANELVIDKDVISWMKANMEPGNDNSTKGQSFTFETPGNDFTIVPIYQGIASYTWELWVNIDGQDHFVWKKGQGVSYSTVENPNPEDKSQWTTLGTGKNGVPDDATAVKAPTMTLSSPSGLQMYFYLKVFGGTNPSGGTIKTSLEPMKMLALENAQRPKSVPSDYECTIIGCEDSGTIDQDFEDLVFMVYGKPVPSIKYHEDVDVIEAKRYMIEDLGGADDFDFNDIVVDLQRYSTVRHKYAGPEGNVQWVGDETLNESKRAIIRAAGGTHDFTVEIGSKSWTKSQNYDALQMLNTGWQGEAINWNAELGVIELSNDDWDGQSNNIKVTVQDSNGIKVVSFPKQGEVPLIISVDPNSLKNWMTERKDIPKSWTVWE